MNPNTGTSHEDRQAPGTGLGLWAENRERERLIAARLEAMTPQGFAAWCAWLFDSPESPLPSSWRSHPVLPEAVRLFDEFGRAEPHRPEAFRSLAERLRATREPLQPAPAVAHQAALWLSGDRRMSVPGMLTPAVAQAAGARVWGSGLPAGELEAAIRRNLRSMAAASRRFAQADDRPEFLVMRNDELASSLVSRLSRTSEKEFAEWRHWAFSGAESPARNWFHDEPVAMLGACFGRLARGEPAPDLVERHDTLCRTRTSSLPALHAVREAAIWLAGQPDRRDPRFLSMAVGMLRSVAGWEAAALDPVAQANAETDALLAMHFRLDPEGAPEPTGEPHDDGPGP